MGGCTSRFPGRFGSQALTYFPPRGAPNPTASEPIYSIYQGLMMSTISRGPFLPRRSVKVKNTIAAWLREAAPRSQARHQNPSLLLPWSLHLFASRFTNEAHLQRLPQSSAPFLPADRSRRARPVSFGTAEPGPWGYARPGFGSETTMLGTVYDTEWQRFNRAEWFLWASSCKTVGPP